MATRLVRLALALRLTLKCMAQEGDPNAPSLLFNWTLYPVDVPLVLDSGWVQVSDDAHAATSSGADRQYNEARVQFVGSGMAFHGTSSGWGLTGTDGLPKRSATASVNGDPTWISNGDLFQSYSDSVIWQRSTPRFKEYTMSILKLTNSNWTLESAEIMTGMNSSAATFADVPVREEKIVNDDGSYNAFYNRTGRWEVMPAADGLPQRAKCYDDAIMRVQIPKGTAYVLMHGIRAQTGTNMYFSWTDDIDSGSTTQSLNTVYPRTAPGLFYMKVLNTAKTYTLVWTCVFTPTYGQQEVTSMTFYGDDVLNAGKSTSTPNGVGTSTSNGNGNGSSTSSGKATAASNTAGTGSNGSTGNGSTGNGNGNGNGNGSTGGTSSNGSGSKFPTGAIIGIVVGVVVLALLGLLLMYVRRRRNRPPPMAPHGGMQSYQSGRIDGDLDPNVYPTPYTMPQPYTPQQPYPGPGMKEYEAAPPSYGNGSVYNSGAQAPYVPYKQ